MGLRSPVSPHARAPRRPCFPFSVWRHGEIKLLVFDKETVRMYTSGRFPFHIHLRILLACALQQLKACALLRYHRL